MSIDIVPELHGILEHIKGELDKELGSSSEKIVELLRVELSPVFEELSKTKQRNGELEIEPSKAKLDCVESVISRLFEVLSDIRSESSLRKVDDFDKYVEELRKLTKPLGMKIYCYKNGESIPEEDLSILELRYQQTNDSDLDKKVCSTECIGFRLNDLDMKRSAKVTIYGYKEGHDPEEYARIAESIKIDHMNSLLQKAKVVEEEKRDIISEVGSFFEGIQKPEDIDSEQKLKLCISFGEICPDYNKGRFADCLGRYYEEIGQGSIHDALKWYTIGMNYGVKHSTRRVKAIKSKLKR